MNHGNISLILPRHYLTLPNGEVTFQIIFCSNTFFQTKILTLPSFYTDLFEYWSEVSHQNTDYINGILSESLWYNNFIKIGQNVLFFKVFHNVSINKVGDLFEKDGKPVQFQKVKQLGIPVYLYFKWIQLIE